LSGRKRQLLFINYGYKKLIYMKPENYGISGVINALLHGAEFIIEILGRIGPIRIIFCIKPNDHLIYHKEQIPANIKKAYQSMLKTCKIDRKSKEYSNHSNSIAMLCIIMHKY